MTVDVLLLSSRHIVRASFGRHPPINDITRADLGQTMVALLNVHSEKDYISVQSGTVNIQSRMCDRWMLACYSHDNIPAACVRHASITSLL
jgi:hypothetical protein